jgi:thiol-disulfide isomerase/thioredoxin
MLHKQCIAWAILALLALQGFAQHGFTVRTKINNPGHHTITLAYAAKGSFVIDSSHTAVNGYITFNGQVDGPVLAYLFVGRDTALSIQTGNGFIPGPSLSFFLSNDVIQIKGEADLIYKATVTGGAANDEWAAIKAEQGELAGQTWDAMKRGYGQLAQNGDSTLFKKWRTLREENNRKGDLLERRFIELHPGSLVSIYFLAGMVNGMSLEELRTAFGKLSGTYKGTDYGKSISAKIKGMEATAIGKQAIPLNKKDMNGNTVNLASLTGKYVLLDFWGSWCGPCRGSHPDLRMIYAKYKERGLEIVGIAQEQAGDIASVRKIWLNAIREDSINWIQVLNNEGIGDFDAVKAYGITAFPTKILLDKEGRIIGRFVGGGEEGEGPLKAKLEQLLGGVHPLAQQSIGETGKADSLQQPFTIKGKLENLQQPLRIFLSFRVGSDMFKDSVITRDGRFSFSGKLSQLVVKASLSAEPVIRDTSLSPLDRYLNRDEQDLFIETGETVVNGVSVMKTAAITGGKTQSDYNTLQGQLISLNDEMAPLSKKVIDAYKRKEQGEMDSISALMKPIRKEINSVEENFVSAHPDSYVSLELVAERGSIINVETFEPLYNQLSERLRNSDKGKALGHKLAIAKNTGIGRPALPFTENNPEDVPVSLSSFKGKYVLIDFWASWCGPCRAENPNVVKAYNKFHARNFEIISVSLDEKKEPWVKAIEKDGMPWTHVSDLKGWQNSVAVQYAVTAVPQNFLLDPNGIIIAKNLRGEELDKKLAELIKE